MFRILHLSDLHASPSQSWSIDPILNGVRDVLLRETESDSLDVVAFTGDIANRGKASEFEYAEAWIDRVFLSQTGLNLNKKSLLFVPGNHDVDRDLISVAATSFEESLSKATSQADIAKYYMDRMCFSELIQRHTAYQQFCKRMRGTEDLRLASWSQQFNYGSATIEFEGLCTSWLCRGADDHGRLLVGQPQFSERIRERKDADIRVALMHHPLLDLKEFDRVNCEQHFRQFHDIVLRGHLHLSDAVSHQAGSGGFVELASGSLHEAHESRNKFHIIDIEEDASTIQIRTYAWTQQRWILDRNEYPESHDGIFRWTLPRKPSRTGMAVRADRVVLESVPAAIEATAAPDTTGSKHDESSPNFEQAAEAELSGFPRFTAALNPEDKVIRQSLLEHAMLTAEQKRLVRIHAVWGTNPITFVSVLFSRLRDREPALNLLHARCGGARTGLELQAALSANSGTAISILGKHFREIGACALLLDDLEVSDSDTQSSPSVSETIATLLDFCPMLTIVTMHQCSYTSLPAQNEHICLGPLDAADVRAYAESHHAYPTKLERGVDYDRITHVTGGIPYRIENVLESLQFTDLNTALLQSADVSELPSNVSLPEFLAQEIVTLAASEDDHTARSYAMLTALSFLENGESLSVLRRVQPQSPLWPKHAKTLQELGLLDVMDAAPQRRTLLRSMTGDKILRVPRVVRDFVLAKLSPDARRSLLNNLSNLYFGEGWRASAVRIRSRPSLAEEFDATHVHNEHGILRALLIDCAKSDVLCGPQQGITLALKYIDHLYNKGLYGEAFECAQDVLGIALQQDSLCIFEAEIAEMRLIAGKCARMLGERTASVELLSAAVSFARASGVRDRLQDVFLSLALAYQGLDRKHEALEAAKEVEALASKNSGHYLHARAVVIGFESDVQKRKQQLQRLEAKARNLGHHTVANNIALELIGESVDVEDTLRRIAVVKSSSDRHYNYIRATLRRVETLLSNDRFRDISDLDWRDVNRSYSWAYAQRLGGTFDWCHRVYWDLLCAAKNYPALHELFQYSSFIWRLSGDQAHELRYANELAKLPNAASGDLSNSFAAVVRYCQTRISELVGRMTKSGS